MNAMSGDRHRLDRSIVALGVGVAASPLLGLAEQTPPRLVNFGAVGVIVTLVLAVGAVAGGIMHVRPLVIVAGLGFLASAILQTTQSAVGGADTLGGDGSTVALHFGFAVGLLALGVTPVDMADATTASSDGDG